MSSSTWTREELLASALAIETTVWRAVEAQHRVSTMKLVDTLAEQEALERVLEESKPPVAPAYRHLNYLLFSPFRYSRDNPFASRFRRAHAADGVFYASASPETAIAEMVFYRMLFYAESPDTSYPNNPAQYTAFAVPIRAHPGLDLTRPPMSAYEKAWTSERDYAQCQALADAARAEHVQAICYLSVRDLQHRTNYALLTPAAFAQSDPVAYQSWHIHLKSDGALATCEAPVTGLAFTKSDFAADPRLRT